MTDERMTQGDVRLLRDALHEHQEDGSHSPNYECWYCDTLAEKIAPVVERIVAARVEGVVGAVEAAARSIHARQEYSTCWDDGQAGSLSRMGTEMRPLGELGRTFYRSLARAALTAAKESAEGPSTQTTPEAVSDPAEAARGTCPDWGA